MQEDMVSAWLGCSCLGVSMTGSLNQRVSETASPDADWLLRVGCSYPRSATHETFAISEFKKMFASQFAVWLSCGKFSCGICRGQALERL